MAGLPAWDEITKSSEWQALTVDEKRNVYHGYLEDLGKVPEWKGLKPDEKNNVLNAMRDDAGPWAAPEPLSDEPELRKEIERTMGTPSKTDLTEGPPIRQEVAKQKLQDMNFLPTPAKPPTTFTQDIQNIGKTLGAGAVMEAGELGGQVKPPFNEPAFQSWYSGHAKKLNLNPNPDDPQHFYDYRAAYLAGATPDETGHWPSEFKRPGHPNRYVNGIDTITGKPAQKPTTFGEDIQSALTTIGKGATMEAGKIGEHAPGQVEGKQESQWIGHPYGFNPRPKIGTPVDSEEKFMAWANSAGIENPDDPQHYYDYRKAYASGVNPIPWSNLPEQQRESDIKQLTTQYRHEDGSPISTRDAIEYLSGRFMWPEEFKLPGRPKLEGQYEREDEGRYIEKPYQAPGTSQGPFEQKRAPEESLMRRGLNWLGGKLGIPLTVGTGDKKISPTAVNRALIQKVAGEEKIPLSEYREGSGFFEKLGESAVRGATAGIPAAVTRETTGEEPFPVTSMKEYAGAGLGEALGFIAGPAKAAHGVPILKGMAKIPGRTGQFIKGRILDPEIIASSPIAYRTAITAIREGVGLVPATMIAQFGPAMEKTNFKDAAVDILKAAPSGAILGATFGIAKGLFPKMIMPNPLMPELGSAVSTGEAEAHRVARIATGWVLLNAKKVLEGGEAALPWNRTVDEFIFDSVIDAYFLWKGLPDKTRMDYLGDMIEHVKNVEEFEMLGRAGGGLTQSLPPPRGLPPSVPVLKETRNLPGAPAVEWPVPGFEPSTVVQQPMPTPQMGLRPGQEPQIPLDLDVTKPEVQPEIAPEVQKVPVMEGQPPIVTEIEQKPPVSAEPVTEVKPPAAKVDQDIIDVDVDTLFGEEEKPPVEEPKAPSVGVPPVAEEKKPPEEAVAPVPEVQKPTPEQEKAKKIDEVYAERPEHDPTFPAEHIHDPSLGDKYTPSMAQAIVGQEKEMIRRRLVEGTKNGEFPPGTIVRSVSANVLKEAFETGKMPGSLDDEFGDQLYGTQIVDKDYDVFPLYGPYDQRAAAIVIPQKYFHHKTQGNDVVVLAKDLKLEDLKFVFGDGHVYDYGELKQALAKRSGKGAAIAPQEEEKVEPEHKINVFGYEKDLEPGSEEYPTPKDPWLLDYDEPVKVDGKDYLPGETHIRATKEYKDRSGKIIRSKEFYTQEFINAEDQGDVIELTAEEVWNKIRTKREEKQIGIPLVPMKGKPAEEVRTKEILEGEEVAEKPEPEKEEKPAGLPPIEAGKPTTAPKIPEAKPKAQKANEAAAKAKEQGLDLAGDDLSAIDDILGEEEVSKRQRPIEPEEEEGPEPEVYKMEAQKPTPAAGGVDSEKYKKLEPLFNKTYDQTKASGKGLKDLVNFLTNQYGDKIKPYLKQWVLEKQKELRNEKPGTVGRPTQNAPGEVPPEGLPGAEGPRPPGEAPGGPGGQPGRPNAPPTDAGNGAVAGGGTSEPGDLSSGGGRGTGVRNEGGPVRDAPRPDPINYRYTGKEPLEEGGPVAKARRAIDVIKLLKKIESENRWATAEEQTILATYPGWGGLRKVFDRWAHGPTEKGIERFAKELDEMVKSGELTESEYNSIRDSSSNAFWTSPEIVKGLFRGLERLGYTGNGNFMEPASGHGIFFGHMPEGWSPKLVGVEMDPITARIARQLYQTVDLRNDPYEAAILPDNYFDIIASNVPFGDTQPYDRRYSNLRPYIHDFYFMKSVDKLRPGGIIAFVTSTGTMDKQNDAVRTWLSQRTEFLGAVRLPGEAFKKISNTQVTTDLIFLRKLEPNEFPTGEKWQKTQQIEVKGERGWNPMMSVNEYYVKNPEMVLGNLVVDNLTNDRAGVEGDVVNIGEKIDKALEKILKPGTYKERVIEAYTPEKQRELFPAPDFVKDHGHFEGEDGKIYQKVPIFTADGKSIQGWKSEPIELTVPDMQRVKDWITFRTAFRKTLKNQVEGKDEILESDLRDLNAAYDKYVEKFGPLHDKRLFKLIKTDPDFLPLLAAERVDPDTGNFYKTDIFKKKVVASWSPITKADNAKDALFASLNNIGKIDAKHMEGLTGKSWEEMQPELEGLIYRNPETQGWEQAAVYLSGNVKSKLANARAALKFDKNLEVNIAALEKVQPEDKQSSDIDKEISSQWIPPQIFRDFVQEVMQADAVIHVTPITARFIVDVKMTPTNTMESRYGTDYFSAMKLLEYAMNRGRPVAKDKDEETGKQVTNHAETQLARSKMEIINEAFKDWMFKDEQRSLELVKLYNDTMNVYVDPKFDGTHIDRFPGASPLIKLMDQQKNGVWRGLHGGNVLFARPMGSGKTYLAITTGMEMRRIGLKKKILYAVPNATIQQWVESFHNLYPTANVLYPTKDEFTPAERKEFLSRISTGDWDAVLITHENLKLIPMSKQGEAKFIEEEVKDLEMAISQEIMDLPPARPGKTQKLPFYVKTLVDRLKKYKDKLKYLTDTGFKDEWLTFEEIGIDQIIVDEAHKFKNLPVTTRFGSIPGISTGASKTKKKAVVSEVEPTKPETEEEEDPAEESMHRALDLYMKTRYLTKMNNNKGGVIFLTGTPVSNSIAEFHSLMKFLDPELLKSNNIWQFDAWANNFGKIETGIEVSPTGAGFRQNTTFRSFINKPIIQRHFRKFADVLSDEGAKIKRPPIIGNGPRNIPSPMSPDQHTYMDEILDRVEHIKTGQVDPKQDNMLKVTTDARNAAIDMRLIDPSMPDYKDSKVNQMIGYAADIYFKDYTPKKPTEKIVQKVYDVYDQKVYQDKHTMLIFLDQGVPTGGKFNLYKDIKNKLVAKGIPENEIAFMHEYKKEKKLILFDKFNAGIIRVLIGSTGQMGEGVNLQRKVAALLNLDVPWKPSEMKQRNTRGWRPGNMNPAIEIYNFVTEGSFDVYNWQMLEQKERFIDDLMSGRETAFEGDIGRSVLSYAEVKAIASNNPIVFRKFVIDQKVSQLRNLLRNFNDSKLFHKGQTESLPKDIERTQTLIDAWGEDLKAITDYDEKASKDPKKAKIKIDGQSYSFETERDKIEDALLKAYTSGFLQASNKNSFKVGEYKGFELYLKNLWGMPVQKSKEMGDKKPYDLVWKRGDHEYDQSVKIVETYANEVNAKENYLKNLDHIADKIKNDITWAEDRVKHFKDELERAKGTLTETFPKQKEYDEAEAEKALIDAELARIQEASGALGGGVINTGAIPGAEKPPSSVEEEEPEEEGEVYSMRGLPNTIKAAVASMKKQQNALVPTPERLDELSRKQVVDMFRKKLDLIVRQGKFRGRSVLGIWKPLAHVIRLKMANDLPTLFHEAGHGLQKGLGFAGRLSNEVRALDYAPAKMRSHEGFAEFMRLYVEKPAEALARAPIFHGQFEARLNDFPDIKDVLIKARMTWQKIQAGDPVEIIMSFIETGTESAKGNPVTLNQIYQDIKDKFWYLRIISKAAEKAGLKFTPGQDPYLLALATSGVDRTAYQFAKIQPFRKNPITDQVEFIGKSLDKILKPIEEKGERGVFDAYLWARRGLFRRKAIAAFEEIGVTRKTFEDAKAEIEQKFPHFADAAKEIDQYQDTLFQYLVDAGRYTEEFKQISKLKDLFYAPLYKIVENFDPSPLSSLSRTKFGNLFSPVKKLSGKSSLNIWSPTEAMLYNTYTFINVAERNRVGEAIIKLARRAEGIGKFIEKVPIKIKPIAVNAEEAIKGLADILGADKKDLIQVLEDNFNMNQDQLHEMFRIFRPSYVTGPSEALFFERGKPVLIEFGDPNFAKSILGLNAGSINDFVRLLAVPAKTLRAGATTFSTEFPFKNLPKDQFTAFIQSNYGYVPFYTAVHGLIHIIGKSKEWQLYNISGAAHADMTAIDRWHLSRNWQEFMEGKANVKYLVKHPFEMLQLINALGEEATRVGEFALGLEREGEKVSLLPKLAVDAKNVTVNFSRIGARTASLNLITAFWGAQAEGLDRFVRSHTENPIRTMTKSFLGITLPTILLWFANRDDPAYYALPLWRRSLCWNFITHKKDGTVDTVWSVPAPFTYGLAYKSAWESALDYLYKNDKRSSEELLRQLWQSLPGIMPTAIVPLWEIARNRSSFTGAPIVPKQKEGLAPYLRYSDRTHEVSKIIGEALSKVPGPLKGRGASPAEIEHLIRGYGASAGYTALDALDEAIKTFGIVTGKEEVKPKMTLADYPGIRGYIQRFPASNLQDMTDFFDERAKRREQWESKKQIKGVRGTIMAKEFKIPTPPELSLDDKTANAISVARDMVDIITHKRNDLTPEMKRDSIDALYYLMNNMARSRLGKPSLPAPKLSEVFQKKIEAMPPAEQLPPPSGPPPIPMQPGAR